jgi:hypothetical protein
MALATVVFALLGQFLQDASETGGRARQKTSLLHIFAIRSPRRTGNLVEDPAGARHTHREQS